MKASTEKLHSKLGASSAYRWMECPGSIRLCEGRAKESSYFAKEGTAAHELAEECLKNGYSTERFLGENITIGNDVFEVDEDMAEAVQLYLDTIRGDFKPGDDLLVEHKFNLAKFHDGLFGTNDACLYSPKEKLLRVYDYKHGKGVAVEVENNPQLLYYALGASIAEEDRNIGDIELVVVQPRAPHKNGPVRRWKIDVVSLLAWTEDLLNAVQKTKDPNATLKAGDWCTFCDAAGICPELQKAAIEGAQMEFATPGDLEPSQVAAILEKADLIEDWIRSVRAYAHNMAETGAEVPGYKLVQKRAMRKWKNEDEVAAVLTIDFNLGDDEIFSKKIKSPAQVEKLVPKDDRSKLNTYYEAVSSGTTLAPVGDRREAVKGSASADFDAVD